MHGLPSLQSGGVLVTQAPLLSQVSAPLQALPSLHEVPDATLVLVHPVTGSQASVVHGLPSSHAGATPA